MPVSEHVSDKTQLVPGRLRVGLGEDRSDGGGDHLFVALGDMGQQVAHQMHFASLPRGALEHAGDGGLQAGVGVGDHQLDAVEATVTEGTQKAGPEHLVFGVGDIETEHFVLTFGLPRITLENRVTLRKHEAAHYYADRLEEFRAICERERCPYAIVGEAWSLRPQSG
mgnify:CR=1 FL=1